MKELSEDALKSVLTIIDNAKSIQLNGLYFVIIPIQMFGELEVQFDTPQEWAKRFVKREQEKI